MKFGSPPSSLSPPVWRARSKSGGAGAGGGELLRTLLQINRSQQCNDCGGDGSNSIRPKELQRRRTCLLSRRTSAGGGGPSPYYFFVRRAIFYLLLMFAGGSGASGGNDSAAASLTTTTAMAGAVVNKRPPIYDLSSNNRRLFCELVRNSIFNGRPFLIKSVCRSYPDKYLITERLFRKKEFTDADCEMLHARFQYMNVQANFSLNDFQSVINRLSCPLNDSSLVSTCLDDDAYSLRSTCSDCQKSYRRWSCAFYFPKYNGSENATDADDVRYLCTEASRRCPLLIPIDVHSGQPFFTCSGVSALQETTMRAEPCEHRVDSCFITERYPNITVQHEQTAANNIRRNRISAVVLLLNLLLPVVHLIRGHLRLV